MTERKIERVDATRPGVAAFVDATDAVGTLHVLEQRPKKVDESVFPEFGDFFGILKEEVEDASIGMTTPYGLIFQSAAVVFMARQPGFWRHAQFNGGCQNSTNRLIVDNPQPFRNERALVFGDVDEGFAEFVGRACCLKN